MHQEIEYLWGALDPTWDIIWESPIAHLIERDPVGLSSLTSSGQLLPGNGIYLV